MPSAERRRLGRAALKVALVFGTFFLTGFLLSSQLPRLERLARVRVEKFSRERLPARILPGSIEITAFPFGVRAKNVRVLPKEETKDYFDAFEIKRASATLSLFHLIQGQLRLSDVEIDGVDLSLRLPKSKGNDGPPLAGLFDAIDDAPLERASLANVSLLVSSRSARAEIGVEKLDASFEKTRAGLAVDLAARGARARQGRIESAEELDLETRGVFSRNAAFLSGLAVRQGPSHVVANGEFSGDLEALTFDAYDVKARASLRLGPLREWIEKVAPDFVAQAPPVEGRADLEADARLEKGRKAPDLTFSARTEGLKIDRKFFFDRVAASGTARGNLVEIPKATLQNPAGVAEITRLEIARGDASTTIRASVAAKEIDLHALLPTVGADAPVYMKISGEAPECKGELSPTFRISCAVTARASDGAIKASEKTKARIVAFKRLEATGVADFDLKQFTYKAEARTPNGRGRSSGAVVYKEGFQIAYEADSLPFADVETLGELRLEGAVALKGTTEGDSKAATFAMQADGKGLWLEDWQLGDVKANLVYKSGLLAFKNLAGNYATSRYHGRVDVDFAQDRLAVDVTAPYLDAKDLTKAAERKFKLPVEATGTGQAQAKVSGPFRFNALTYDLKSTLYRGAIAGEAYDQARFDVRARDGEVEAQRVEVVRGPASIRLTGRGHPNGDVDAQINGRGIRLENLNALASSGFQLAGLLEFDMGLKGYVLAPDAELHGSLVKSSIGEQAVPDSSFQLRFGKKTIEGGGTLLGDALTGRFTYPLTDDAPFALNLDAQKWNFAPFFAALAGPGARKDYEAATTARVRLASSSGGFWNASGRIEASAFEIRRGSLKIAAPETLVASMRDGRVSIEKFRLEGDGSSLRGTDAPATASSRDPDVKLDAQFNGKIDLSLVALLAPFFEDLRGSLSFAFNVKSGPKRSAILGSAYVDHGYLKLFGLPHSFEEIKADALFNERKLLLNSARCDFAGGRVTADGSVEFKGYKNFPLNVNAQFEKVSLNVPDKVATRGSGHASFTGSWFPFLMKGAYDVRDGLVTMEFESSGAVEGVKRSVFLPTAILRDAASPIAMDLQVSFPRGIEVKNKMVDGRAIGELRVLGTPNKPSILGAIASDKDTKVTFRETIVFEVMTGTATFDDVNDINPRLYVNARTRMQTPQQDYDISLVVQGRAKDPKVTLSSQPPRAEKDIISLLALGTDTSSSDVVVTATPTSPNGKAPGLSSGTQVAGTGATVGATLLSKPINDEIKRKTGIDVTLTSSFDDTTNGTVPKVIASRQFTPKFGFSASRSFGQEPKTDAKLKYRLTNKLSALGSWEGLDRADTGEQAYGQRTDTLNKFGLDLEYKFEFK